jgi:hypothetical protein
MNDGGGSGGSRRALGEKRRVVKVVKSPRCALCGFEYQVWEGGVRVLGDRKVKVHPSGARRTARSGGSSRARRCDEDIRERRRERRTSAASFVVVRVI